MKMSKWVLTLGIVFGIWTAASAAETTPAAAEKPAVLDALTASVTATVENIDRANRRLTLKAKDGTTQVIDVPAEVTRFDEVKKGDEVMIDYLESVAVVVQSPSDSVMSAEGSKSVIVRNKGKKPSGTLTQTDVTTATVVKIDAKKRTATLRSPQGDTFDIDVQPDVKNLENVKKGDQVYVKHTRTVALDIRKPSK